MTLHRRQFLLGAVAIPALAAKKPAPPRPNVVLIETRDLGAYMLGCYGNAEMHTPNLDRMTQTGVRFVHSFADGSEPAISEVLAGAGYNCGAGIEFLDSQSAGKPFFLLVKWPVMPAQEIPQKYLDLYASAQFDHIGREGVATADQMRTLRKYAAGVSMLDDQLAALLSKLQARGVWDNTAVIFTSSSGYLLGQHGLWGDGMTPQRAALYEEVVRVPLIWTYPALFPPQTVVTEVVGARDLLPTVCEVTGATPPATSRGRSYLPIGRGQKMPKKEPWPGVAFGRAGNTEMVRDDRYKVILRDQGKGECELYDEAADPREMVNQYANPQFVSVRERLGGELAAWRSGRG